jgi:hypothetical protein
MGYQLLVWEGPRPEDDAAAELECREMFRRYFVGEGFEATPAIREFVQALTERWPEDEEHFGGEDSPWKFPPLLEEASGPAVFLNLRFGIGERAAYVMAEMAEERGLIAFDLYMEIMRPAPKEVTDAIERGWWAHALELAGRLDHRQ